MNKKLIIGLVAAVVLVAGGYFAYTQMNKDTEDSTNKSASTNESTDAKTDNDAVPSGTNTLRNLMGLGNSIMCTYNSPEDSGILYVAGEKRMRYNYTSTNAEYPDGSMIVSGDTIYMWEKDSAEGMKITSQGNIDDTALDNTEEGVDLDKEQDYDCKKWTVDNNVFTPPSNVTFTDLSEALSLPQQ